ncbi:NAD(P)-binding domain-containing protein [Pseudomonas sp. LRF_L74]|uniref:NAD(P)-binding domain-containing protein n=1 Tax=Pseudomonas sp. LRF_L74 TaxID=3369422 RepID=UPI003F618495
MSEVTNPDELVQRYLGYLGPAPENWVPATPGVDVDVLVVGAGHTGLSLGYALQRAGIANSLVIDAAEEGQQSIWRGRARMKTLRTPKTAPGPELGNPVLGFQAWFETRNGAEAFAAIGRIPTPLWAEYLDWLRGVLKVPVRFATRLVAVEPRGEHVAVTLQAPAGQQVLTVRKLVLATGLGGLGGANIPALVRELPERFYSHSDSSIDFSSFADKRVAVLGAGPSAFDQAATALEAGASEVHLYVRGKDLVRTPAYRAAVYPGADSFHLLPDADRWQVVNHFLSRGTNPPTDSVLRATAFKNFWIHLDSAWDELTVEGDQVRVRSAEESLPFDHLILATGFAVDPALRPELKAIADDIALWQDRYTPPAEANNAAVGRYPYLGNKYELQPRVAGNGEYLKNIHAFNYSAFVTFCRVLGDIPSLRVAVPRLVSGISEDLFLADREAHLARLTRDVEPDLSGEEYVANLWHGREAR